MKRRNNNKQTRQSYSISQKYSVIIQHEKHPNMTQTELSQKFKISCISINSILKNKHKIKNLYCGDNKEKFKIHDGNKKELEDELYMWFSRQRNNNKIISNDILTIAALEIAKQKEMFVFKASNTWINSFKKKYGIKERMISGEEQLVDTNLLHENKEAFFKKNKFISTRKYF
ncbi:Major centromere autoantigen B [Dictyocoela muelleri]|nr:Major centromere autoantigen B [Dictyocoela muelleri]